jgi:hypothetical protein
MSSNPYMGVPISEETHQRLTKLKGENDTFDDVVNKLLELEETYNMPEETMEYEYILPNGKTKVFRVVFGDKTKIEYYNRRKYDFEKDIRAWFTGERISDSEINSFIRFIVKDSNLMLLYDMDEELVLNDIHIRRV